MSSGATSCTERSKNGRRRRGGEGIAATYTVCSSPRKDMSGLSARELARNSAHARGSGHPNPNPRHERKAPVRHFLSRHARLYAGHPRLAELHLRKTWMAGTCPAMTVEK